MAEMETLAAIKNALRIKHDKLDDELAQEIDACLRDLEVCGIEMPNEADPLILRAIKLFVRSENADDVAKAQAFKEAYNSLKGTLMVAGDYGGGRS